MGKNRYVGHRYIPIFENGWDKTRTYEPLTFVYYEGKTYVSRQLVPTNIEITDNDFWAFFMDNTPQIFTPTFTGQWEDKPYEPLSIVVNNGNTYVSKQDVPVGTVLTDETYWLDLSTYYNQLFTGYETAEQERQQAEAIRVENEKQREIDHANRSAELAGKADKKQEDWITVPLFNGAEHGVSPLKVMKDEMGVVHFKGSLTNLVSGNKVFGLPVGYRPDIGVTESRIRMSVALNTERGINTLQINYVGDGYISNSSNEEIAFFDGVSYLAKRG